MRHFRKAALVDADFPQVHRHAHRQEQVIGRVDGALCDFPLRQGRVDAENVCAEADKALERKKCE